MHRENDEVCLCSGFCRRIRNPRNCEHLEAPEFQAKVAFISELPNHPIVEMLCPLSRCNVLVNDYYVKLRPVDQVERSVAISNWRKLHGIMDTFAVANRLFGFSFPASWHTDFSGQKIDTSQR